VRRRIFTGRERRLLEEWILDGSETAETRKLLSWIRHGFPRLAEDLEVLFLAIRTMQERRRWRVRLARSSELGSALRLAESGLKRPRRGGST